MTNKYYLSQYWYMYWMYKFSVPVYSHHITETCPYKSDLLKTPILYSKTGVYIIFLIFAQNHRLWVLVRAASERQV